MTLIFRKERGHYWLDTTPVIPSSPVCAATSRPTISRLMVWHMRFGHPNLETMKRMVRMGMFDGLDLTLADFKTPFRCIACQRAKQKRMSFKRHYGKRQKRCCARLMSDISPVGILTPGGNLYFQLVEDEASRFKWGYLFKEKSDANANTMNLILKLEKEHTIKMFSR